MKYGEFEGFYMWGFSIMEAWNAVWKGDGIGV